MRWSLLLMKALTVHCAKHTAVAHTVKNTRFHQLVMVLCIRENSPTCFSRTHVWISMFCFVPVFICLLESNCYVCVSGRSDSFDSPYMAQIISRIREPGQSVSMTHSTCKTCMNTTQCHHMYRETPLFTDTAVC